MTNPLSTMSVGTKRKLLSGLFLFCCVVAAFIVALIPVTLLMVVSKTTSGILYILMQYVWPGIVGFYFSDAYKFSLKPWFVVKLNKMLPQS